MFDKSCWIILVVFFTKKTIIQSCFWKISTPPPWKWKHSLPLPFLSFWILTQRSYLTHQPPCTFTLEVKDIWPILSLSLQLTISKTSLTKMTFDNFPLFTRPRSSFLSFLHSFTGRCLNESSTDGALSALSSLRLVAIFSYFRITSRLRMFTFSKSLLFQLLWLVVLCSARFVGWSLMKVWVQVGWLIILTSFLSIFYTSL